MRRSFRCNDVLTTYIQVVDTLQSAGNDEKWQHKAEDGSADHTCDFADLKYTRHTAGNIKQHGKESREEPPSRWEFRPGQIAQYRVHQGPDEKAGVDRGAPGTNGQWLAQEVQRSPVQLVANAMEEPVYEVAWFPKKRRRGGKQRSEKYGGAPQENSTCNT
jgi:hypothetical protein